MFFMDKTNLNLITQNMVLNQQQQDADKHEKFVLANREKAVEERVKESYKAQIEELNQDIKELTTLNTRYRTELSKPQNDKAAHGKRLRPATLPWRPHPSSSFLSAAL